MSDIFNTLDYSIIIIYMIFMILIGIFMKKYADRGTDNYFIGGKIKLTVNTLKYILFLNQNKSNLIWK